MKVIQNIIINSINIIEGKTNCWKCNQNTSVYGFAVESRNISDLTSNYPVNISVETGYDLIICPISANIRWNINSNYCANIC